MGLTTQMIAWPDELCEGLARCGFSSSGSVGLPGTVALG